MRNEQDPGLKNGAATAEMAGGRHFDGLINSRAGQLFAKTLIAANLAGAIAPAFAAAEGGSSNGSSNTTVVNTETGVTVNGAHSWEKDGDHSQVNVMGNHRTFSKAEVEQMEENGQCRWFNGKKVKIYTEGLGANGVAMGRDYRKSEFCATGEDVDGDGDSDWVRVRCGNGSVIGETPEGALEEVIWVGGKTKFRVHAEAEAKSDAYCKTSNGLAGASSQGSGRASANGFVKLHGSIKMRVKQAQGEVDATVDMAVNGKAGAKAKAFSIADAQCTETPGTPPPNTPGNTPPYVDVDNPNHVAPSGTIAFCEREGDTDGYIAGRSFNVVSGGGNFTSVVYPGNDPNEFCVDYTGPSTAGGNVILSATVTDNSGNSATDSSAPIQVYDIPK